MESREELGWASLPQDVLCLILEKLFEAIDAIWFGAVCTSWHSALKTYKEMMQRQNKSMYDLPMLMVPIRKGRKKRKLYSVAKNKVYNFRIKVLENKRCCGSRFGWMAFEERENMTITLFNPFRNGDTIILPSFDGCELIQKVFFSADPALYPQDFMVFAIYGSHSWLAYWKSGQESWTKLDEQFMIFTDVAFYNNLVFATEHRSMVISFDTTKSTNDASEPPQVKVVAPMDWSEYAQRTYLVESTRGELWMVRKFIERECFTKGFEVYKLQIDTETGLLMEKIELKYLEGDALFVGDNHSISIPANSIPGCMPNSIYYTDDYIDSGRHKVYGPRDMGVYHLEDGSIRKHYEFQLSEKQLPPAFWITPPVL